MQISGWNLCTYQECTGIVTTIYASIDVINKAIELGANPNGVTIEDMTKLASSGKLSIVMLILEETKPENSKKLWNYFRSLKPDN